LTYGSFSNVMVAARMKAARVGEWKR